MATWGKLPIPRLPAYNRQRGKRKKTLEERKEQRRVLNKKRDQTRVNIGEAYPRWRALREGNGLKNDAEVAQHLLDSYLQNKSENQQPRRDRTSSTESSDSECLSTMSSPGEAEQVTSAAPLVQSSENGKESGGKDAAAQIRNNQEELMTTNQSENTENQDIQEDEEEDEVSTSLSVGDGRYLVDLGNPSEFIVDEKCILQLFKTCRECNRQCTVRKYSEGLKIVVNQRCMFCDTHCKWTNLPDDGEEEFQINGKHGQTNSAKQ